MEEEDPAPSNLSCAQMRRLTELVREFKHLDPTTNKQILVEYQHQLQQCDVKHLYQTHDTVPPTFKNCKHQGVRITKLVDDLRSREVCPSDLPPLVVVCHLGKHWAMTGNRRLYCLKLFAEWKCGPVKVNCIVHILDDGSAIPPAIVAKFIHASTTRNEGESAVVRGGGSRVQIGHVNRNNTSCRWDRPRPWRPLSK